MSKEVLKDICTSARKDSYSWALYFFKIDKRAKQPAAQTPITGYISILRTMTTVLRTASFNSATEANGTN